jgi:hypothetical protein
MYELTGGLWVPRSVTDTPEVCLSDWSVFEVQMRGSETRTRHFVGTNISERSGRTSSRIESFDASTRQGLTQSGRVYQLLGTRTGLSGDASYTWNAWLRINAATDVVDVTDEISRLLGDTPVSTPNAQQLQAVVNIKTKGRK